MHMNLIENPEYDAYESYRKRSSRTQESRISYKKPEYKYAEIWDYSSRNAIKITQDPNTGEQTRTSYIGNPGNSSMKVRKIERKSASDKDWKINITRTYDDNGNIIREIDNTGNIQEWEYNGKLLHTIKKNGIIFFLRKYDGSNLIEENEILEDRKVKRIFKDNMKLVIEDRFKENRTSYTLWIGNEIKSIRTIRNEVEKNEK